MAGNDRRHTFRGDGQYIFSNARLFPVPEFADRGDAFVPRTTLNLRDYNIISNNMVPENENWHLHWHWNWHWHWHWHWHLPALPQQAQVEAPYQTERLLDEPEDFLLYDYYDTESEAEESDAEESVAEEPDTEDFDVGDFDLEGSNDADKEAGQSLLSHRQEKVKSSAVGGKRRFREDDDVVGGSTKNLCEGHKYVLGDFERHESPSEKRSPEGSKKRTWEDFEGEEKSCTKRFCDDHEYIRKDF